MITLKAVAEISRLVEAAFLILADANRQTMVLCYFTRAIKSKKIQRHLLAVTSATIKEAAQAVEDYLAIEGVN